MVSSRSLHELLESPQNPDRRLALERVPAEGTLTTAAICHRIARCDRDPVIRTMATQALRRLANRVGELPPDPKKIVWDLDAEKRATLITDIALSQEAEFVPALIERAVPEDDAHVRAALALTIGILGSPAHRQILETFVTDRTGEVRLASLEALDLIGHTDSLPFFVRSLRDPEATVRSRAMQTLSRQAPGEIIELCRTMVAAAEPWRRESAAHLLGTSGVAEAIPLLSRAAEDDVVEVREAGIKGLGSLTQKRVPGAAEALAKAPKSKAEEWVDSVFEQIDTSAGAVEQGPLADADPSVRLKAIETAVRSKSQKETEPLVARAAVETDTTVLARILVALGQLQSRDSIPTLQKALRHQAADVRRGAIEGLRLINDHASLGEIVPLLADREPDVRAWAVIALAVREDVDVTTPLRGLIGASNEAEVLFGIEAIEQIKTRRAIELAVGLRAHASTKVREAVLAMLRRLAEKKNPTALAILRESGEVVAEPSATARPAGPRPGRTYKTAPKTAVLAEAAVVQQARAPAQPQPPAAPATEAAATPVPRTEEPRAGSEPESPEPASGSDPWPPPRAEASLLALFGLLEIGRVAPGFAQGAELLARAVAVLGLVVASWALARAGSVLRTATGGAASPDAAVAPSGWLAVAGLVLLLAELAFCDPSVAWALTAAPLVPLLGLAFSGRR